MMEIELEPRVKPLPFKVKAMSRESPSQKATNVLDSDLRTHWSTGSNTKEWILLELDEPCLLSHIRIYNKSVLEWEISAGLRYKPETFVKVRPRCEAPRRDMLYPMNYTACRYIRVACLRGNPIAIFFIQLIGVSVAGLEPEFQPVVNYLLPHIISHKQDSHDLHLQLLQDISHRLLVFLPQLENDLNSFPDAADSKICFFAMLVGPFYPILHLVNERASNSAVDSDPLRNKSSSTLAISSNFEVQPRRSRSPLPSNQIACSSIAFRSETVLVLLRKAFENSHLGTICRVASRALQILLEPVTSNEDTIQNGDSSTLCKDDCFKNEATCRFTLNDYSGLFGDEFKIYYDHPDDSCMNLLDISVVEEAILHVLYASASEPTVCRLLVENAERFWPLLPLIQALLPALRPSIIITEQVDETFYQWKTALVQRALAQITSVSSSMVSCSLLRASAGYLLSFQRSQVRAACVLIDLHFGPLAPWSSTLVVKVDLAIELLEDLLDAIQLTSQSTSHARAALKYVILGLSGHMDDVLLKYKEVKHKVLFLVEMLEPFLDPAISSSKPTIAFGDAAVTVPAKQEQTCAIALNVIRTAVQRAAVLPSLESEWRRGTVAPSVLLSVLGPHMTLPDEIDSCKCTVKNIADEDVLLGRSVSSARNHGLSDGFDAKSDLEASSKNEGCEDANFLFAATELKNMDLMSCSFPEGFDVNKKTLGAVKSNFLEKHNMNKFSVEPFQGSVCIMAASSSEGLKFHADYLQLINLDDAERRASEFQRLALDLHLQVDATPEGHFAAIDALLLAAECYTNPFFMISFRSNPKVLDQLVTFESHIHQKKDMVQMTRNYKKNMNDLDSLLHSETRRDKIVLEILIKAAKWEFEHLKSTSKEHPHETENFGHGFEMSVEDMGSADAVTLLRQNQALLCHFLTQRLLSSQQILHEVLLQAMCFYLRTATELFCSPDDIVKIIIQYAEHLNKLITSFYNEVDDHNDKLEREKLYSIQRHWSVLQKLVMASSGSDIGLNSGNIVNVSHYGSLVPLVSWIQEISAFSHSPFPLARYVGWMAISHFAKQYINEQIHIILDLSSLTNLLSIFLDELVLSDDTVNQNVEAPWSEKSNNKHPDRCKLSGDCHSQGFVNIPYPDLYVFLPDLKLQFRTFGELILEAVTLQLKAIPAVAISDVLCWFSGFCLAPFSWKDRFLDYIADSGQHLRGNVGRNAKAIILYLLESIVSAHMEAMVPEMPRLAQMLMSLCMATYCDVDFLDSFLRLLNPLISYAFEKASDSERLLVDHTSYHDFENLCFEDIFDYIRGKVGGRDGSTQHIYQGPLIVFLLGSLFSYLSLSTKKDILQYVTSLADFKLSAPSSYLDYLKAFQNIVDSCIILLVQSLKLYNVLVPDELQVKVVSGLGDSPESPINTSGSSHILIMKKIRLSYKDIDEILRYLEELFSKLHPAVESCWRLHSQLAHKITLASGKCYLLMRCMASLSCIDDKIRDETNADERGTVASDHWKNAVEDLNVKILALQNDNCWQIARSMLDFLLGLPEGFPLDHIISSICSAIKGFCCRAPRISWRLQSDKWLTVIFNRIRPLQLGESSLVDLFCTMLGHTEPEQRAVALRHLGGLVGLDINNGVLKLTYGSYQDNASAGSVLQTSEKMIFNLVSRTWDKVATLTSSDPLLLLRASAMALLSGFIPFAQRSQLQSLFASSDGIVPGIGLHVCPTQQPLMLLSLNLLARACVYSLKEDIHLIPESVWGYLEGNSTCNSGIGNVERKICEAMCNLRSEDGDAKEVLNKAFPSNSAFEQTDPDFERTRGSIFEVLGTMPSIQSYMDFFSKKKDQEAQELEEAEIEMELLLKEKASLDSQAIPVKEPSFLKSQDHLKDSDCLMKLRNEIRELERSRLRVEVATRRQKKLLAEHARQKYLEEAASREMELLQELDRERTNEMEQEIERQRLLEIERAKTRELRYNLDLEREKQTQRELQRELEQAESGVQVSRKEFPSSTSSGRTRERYRDRDGGRMGGEGSIRPSSRGRENIQTSTSGPQVPTLVLAGSNRSFPGSIPTILQVRDRSDERGVGYEEGFDGSRDSGDTGSVGDQDSVSGFDGLPGGFGLGGRHGSRGAKSRQIMERREREGRREGKWERKHS